MGRRTDIILECVHKGLSQYFIVMKIYVSIPSLHCKFKMPSRPASLLKYTTAGCSSRAVVCLEGGSIPGEDEGDASPPLSVSVAGRLTNPAYSERLCARLSTFSYSTILLATFGGLMGALPSESQTPVMPLHRQFLHDPPLVCPSRCYFSRL